MDKIYIGIYGGVNSGKSSLINRLSGQNTAIVSPERGTTTDPVKKLMELDGIGPAVLIDTAGVDDDTALASSRVAKTLQTLDIIDMAVLVVNAGATGEADKKLISVFKKRNIPFLIVNNKSDRSDFKKIEGLAETVVEFSAQNAQSPMHPRLLVSENLTSASAGMPPAAS